MSISLQVTNGDLALSGTNLGTVQGFDKLVQDLRFAILTRMGSDPNHPDFGSIIDGGRLPDGTVVDSMLGGLDWSHAALSVEAEIRRICANYQRRQISRNQADSATFGKPTLTPDEVLVRIDNIRFTQAQDNLLVSVTLSTGAGSSVLNVPISMTA